MTELIAPEPQLARLNQLFASDPGLTAALLRAANEERFGAHRQVIGIPQALALMPNAALRALTAAAPVGTAARNVPGMSLQQFWRYSLETARMARSLAGILRLNPVAAFAAGMLHAVGELVIHRAECARINSINALAGPFDLGRVELEMRLFGFSYAQVSGGLARRWQLPQVLVEALSYQTNPLDNDSYEPLAAVLNLAVWRARAGEARLNDRELAVTFPGEIGTTLGLDIDTVLQQDPINWKPGDRDD
ncbi:HDOD domain-containing protein [Diaphorobacter aerolatus]|uniref:HDOD domain-containing protein n=1 Tax=Diaphorobacter aerolatus TaxID=1288495 RepID=A0A7H0GQT0_9BURK|nr:HDOD domain-containing protein [Diaphorobacter aerolatus]QNP50646.1 HDOD domain-containing protein [Diaphorobacter aerolatus]